MCFFFFDMQETADLLSAKNAVDIFLLEFLCLITITSHGFDAAGKSTKMIL